MISCSKCKKATLPVSDGGCIKTGGIVDIGCKYGEPRTITNYDRIISKTPEKMAKWLDDKGTCPPGACTHMYDGVDCPECWLDWLKQEVT